MTSRHFPVLRFLGTALLLLLLAGCVSQSSPRQGDLLPPVTTRPTATWHPGRIIWLDLVTPDAKRAEKFYGGLFGWTFEHENNYTVISNNNRRIGGIIELKPEKQDKVAAQWLASMSVNDVDAAAVWVEKQGGKILNGPVDMSRRGRGALISDPEGAYLVILRTRDGDPPEIEPGIGDWLWLEDWTTDLDQTAVFYRKLGGYEKILRENDYVVLINEGKWRAGIRLIREKIFRGRWVPTVRVTDAGALLDKVTSLGGRVLLTPGQTPDNPDAALITDTTGALLVIQPWNFAEEGNHE
ncbi:MAG: VOC family protein [Deltaproteobacteria bacterium]|nr:VOC family protein [Deltaproteobacteria bacterium]